jgi:hypothetical protein
VSAERAACAPSPEARRSADNADAIVAAGGVALLLELLQRHVSEERTVCHICSALEQICADGLLRAHASPCSTLLTPLDVSGTQAYTRRFCWTRGRWS